MKLLIADDDFVSRKMLMAVTKKWGYQPVEAVDGEDAWHILQQSNAPSLLLVDWMMPELDGLGLCQRISEQLAASPPYIILLTAKNDSENVVNGLAAGANDYICKPFDSAELKARLNVGSRMLILQNELVASRKKLEEERRVIENIILKMRSTNSFNPHNIRFMQSPVEQTAGDMLLSAHRPDGAQHIMLGDFTGHGITAAIGGPVISDTFYAMTQKSISLKDIVNEVNRHVFDKLPADLFLAAIFIEIEPVDNLLRIWSCGMPDILIYRHDELVQRVSSTYFALGIVNKELLPPIELSTQEGDRVYCYSDGVTEAMNCNQEEYGQLRLERVIATLLAQEGEIDMVYQSMQQFCGPVVPLDDITLMELSC